tara:strand:+ start:1787 stop:3526 length:1740 start_codon:yes stop_codon:yes gene_type:complete
MLKKILVLVLLSSSCLMQSQIKKSPLTETFNMSIPQEKTYIQTNTNLLLAGEYLYYKVYCLEEKTGTYSKISKLAYVELVGSNNNVVFKHKLKLENSNAQGDFFIPSTILTGNYKLIVYTNWSKNKAYNSFYEHDIYILNPFTTEVQKIISSKTKMDTVIVQQSNTIEDSVIYTPELKLSTNKEIYNTRQKATVTLTSDNYKTHRGNYSLSIRKLDSIEIIKGFKLKSSVIKTPDDIFYLPELRGEIISGKIKALNASSVANIAVTLSIPGKDYIFKIVQTNAEGQFFFNIREDYNSSSVIIQVQEPNKEDYKIVIDEKIFNNYDYLNFSGLELNPNIKSWLEQRNIRNQIENAYFAVKSDSILQNKLNDESFFYPIATAYVLDDYTRFNTVKETFVEIITTASLIKKDGDNKFVLFGNKNTEIDDASTHLNPLILVDGLVIQNNEDIINYSAKNIESISIVNSNYIYGSKFFDGIIAFVTKKGDFKISKNSKHLKQIELKSPLNEKLYYMPNYNKKLNRIPDFRNQLLWKPNVILNEDEVTIEFFTSDNVGKYSVKLEGYTVEGVHITNTKNIIVSNK